MLLGFELLKHVNMWRPTRKKFWRLAGALQWALRPGALLSGKEVERLTGHLVACFMLRRDLLSLLSGSTSSLSELHPPAAVVAICATGAQLVPRPPSGRGRLARCSVVNEGAHI